MSDIAIRVEGLSKKYKIGQRKSGDLRESVNNYLDRFRRHPHINASSHSTEKEFWALKDVSFEIPRGEAVGVIGRNGAGKSTLLKILSRITEPTTGRVEINGRVSSLLEVGTGFHPELTGRENIFLNGTILGMKRREVREKFDEIVDFSGVEKFIDTPIKHYSSGMKVRLAFSVAAFLEPEILLIDEVLAVGDAEFQKKCLGKMEDVTGQGRTVMFVSHQLEAVSKLCEQTILMQDSRILEYGATEMVIASYIGNSDFDNAFDHEIIKGVSLVIQKNQIIISVDYENNNEGTPPSIGFTISNSLGHVICGSNPRISGSRLPKLSQKTGQVIVSFTSSLNKGSYLLSLFAGDGERDYFVSRNCLRFDVAGPEFGMNLGVLKIEPKWDYSER